MLAMISSARASARHFGPSFGKAHLAAELQRRQDLRMVRKHLAAAQRNAAGIVWLELEVDGLGPLEPRYQIGTVPFATIAEEAENLFPGSDVDVRSLSVD